MKLSTWRWPDAAAETARLAAEYSFGPKAAMTAQVKAARQVVAKKRKDRLTAPVREELKTPAVSPHPDAPAISVARDANVLLAVVDALAKDVEKQFDVERKVRIQAANAGGVAGAVKAAVARLLSELEGKITALPTVVVPAQKMLDKLLRELAPQPKVTEIPAHTRAVGYLNALHAANSPAFADYIGGYTTELQRLYDASLTGTKGLLHTVATGLTAWQSSEAARQVVLALQLAVSRVLPADDQPSAAHLAQFTSLLRPWIRKQFGKVMQQHLEAYPQFRGLALGRVPIHNVAVLKAGSDAGNAYFAGAILTAALREYGGPNFRNRRHDKSKKKQHRRRTELLLQCQAPRPTDMVDTPAARPPKRSRPASPAPPSLPPPPTPPVTPLLPSTVANAGTGGAAAAIGATAAETVPATDNDSDSDADAELPDSDEEVDADDEFRQAVLDGTLLEDDESEDFWEYAADEIDLSTVANEVAPPGLLEMEMDEDPNDPKDFQGQHIDWRFKIDLVNKHKGRGLFYPTEPLRKWRGSVERMRAHEGGLENQQRWGKHADEKLRVALLANEELREAFYACFSGVTMPDHDVDTMHIYMVEWMWAADTDRRLDDVRTANDCHKSKSQLTTRNKAGGAGGKKGGKKRAKKQIAAQKPQKKQKQQQNRAALRTLGNFGPVLPDGSYC